MKAYSGARVQLCLLLALALDCGERSNSRPGRFSTGKKTPEPSAQEVVVGPIACFDSSAPTAIRTPDRPAHS